MCAICKPSQYCPRGLAIWSPTLGDPVWTGRLDNMTSRSPFQPQLFCASVTMAENEWGVHNVHVGFLFDIKKMWKYDVKNNFREGKLIFWNGDEKCCSTMHLARHRYPHASL